MYFNVRYTYCGCPIPGETIAQKVARVIKADHAIPSQLVPPNRDDLLAATHPSDHNAVFAMHRKWSSQKSQKNRRKKFARRQKANAALAKVGLLDERDIERSHGHHPAFLMPVPLYYYDSVGAGCVAATGNVVNSVSNTGGIGGCANVSGCLVCSCFLILT
jgi:hypothetical protein